MKAKVIESIIALVLLCAVAVLIIGAIDNASEKSDAGELTLAQQSVERAVAACYASEGCYPQTWEYLKEHYNVRIDEKKFYVHYEIFASNIMPDVTVVRLDETE